MIVNIKIEFVDYRGCVKTRIFDSLQYFSAGSLTDEVEHLKKVNNWQRIIEVTPTKELGQ